MYFCICVVCVFVCGHVVQLVGNSSGSSSHFIINHLKASSRIQSFSWEFLCVLLFLTILILIIDNHKVNFLSSDVFKLSPVVHLRVCRARNNPLMLARRVCNIGSEQPTLHCIATLWLHRKRLHSGFALVAVLWCWEVSLHAISRSRRLVDRSLPCQQRFLAVLTFPHFAVWFVHQWQHLLKANGLVKNEQKRNQEKWISSKPSVGKLTKSASDCFRSRSMAFMNPSRKRTKSPLLSRKYEWKYMFWCPHEKCDGILWREKAGRLSSDRLLSVEAAAAFYSQMTSLISNSPRFHFKDDTELGLKTLLIGPQWPHTHAWYGFSILYILCLA